MGKPQKKYDPSQEQEQAQAQALARGTLIHRLLQSLPDIEPARRDAAAQIRMLDVGPGIDDGHFDALTSRPWMRVGDIHLPEAALQIDVGIIVPFGAGRKCL